MTCLKENLLQESASAVNRLYFHKYKCSKRNRNIEIFHWIYIKVVFRDVVTEASF